MFRNRGENLRSVYILLFLNIAFFTMQYQDAEKYVRLFAFEKNAVLAGQVWRLFTYQFLHARGLGQFAMWAPLALFIDLILLTFTGTAVEEEWGTFHFLVFYFLSTLSTVGIAALLGKPLIGSFFISFSLLFVYASIFPQQVLYLISIPVRVSWLGLIALGMLVMGVWYDISNLAALGGAAVGYAYFLLNRKAPQPTPTPRGFSPPGAVAERTSAAMLPATRNVARYSAIKKALSTGSASDIDRLIGLSERDRVHGVNICPPADYKPEHSDGYCVRCEGFAECSARHLRLNRPTPVAAEAVAPAGEVPS